MDKEQDAAVDNEKRCEDFTVSFLIRGVLGCPGIPNIQVLKDQYNNIPVSKDQYPNIPVSKDQYPNIPVSKDQCPNIEVSSLFKPCKWGLYML